MEALRIITYFPKSVSLAGEPQRQLANKRIQSAHLGLLCVLTTEVA